MHQGKVSCSYFMLGGASRFRAMRPCIALLNSHELMCCSCRNPWLFLQARGKRNPGSTTLTRAGHDHPRSSNSNPSSPSLPPDTLTPQSRRASPDRTGSVEPFAWPGTGERNDTQQPGKAFELFFFPRKGTCPQAVTRKDRGKIAELSFKRDQTRRLCISIGHTFSM